jgi:hypothetical protein
LNNNRNSSFDGKNQSDFPAPAYALALAAALFVHVLTALEFSAPAPTAFFEAEIFVVMLEHHAMDGSPSLSFQLDGAASR